MSNLDWSRWSCYQQESTVLLCKWNRVSNSVMFPYLPPCSLPWPGWWVLCVYTSCFVSTACAPPGHLRVCGRCLGVGTPSNGPPLTSHLFITAASKDLSQSSYFLATNRLAAPTCLKLTAKPLYHIMKVTLPSHEDFGIIRLLFLNLA